MVDTEPLARDAWERVAAAHGQTVSDELFAAMLGRRTHESAQLVLDAAGEGRGLPWGVATSTPRAVAEIILGALGLVGRYGALACGDEAPQGKPAPDIYLLAAALRVAPPAACLAL